MSFREEYVTNSNIVLPADQQISNLSIARVFFSFWGKNLQVNMGRHYPAGPVAKNLLANAGVQSLVCELRFHMSQDNKDCVPQLLSEHPRTFKLKLPSLCTAVTEAHTP